MGSKNNIHKWLYSDDLTGKFLMLPPELITATEFINLSHAARLFYIVLNVHKETEEQRSCLYNALSEYNQILNLGMSEQDIVDEAKPNSRTKYSKGYFVAPLKQLEQYGYTRSYVTKLKKELITNGFIKAVYGKKGRYGAWNENTTVYRFCNDWKRKQD